MVSHRLTFLLLISAHSASGIGYWLAVRLSYLLTRIYYLSVGALWQIAVAIAVHTLAH